MSSATTITPTTLRGNWVELVPLQTAHSDALWAVGQHESLWRFMPFAVESASGMHDFVAGLLAQQAQGVAQPFVTTLKATGEVIGSTSFLAIDLSNCRLEIGATWITPAHQRSAANTEAKLLQLEYAFEQLHCNRVEFKTDARNAKSRAALVRLGALEEGTFRKHMVLPNGWVRDSVYFSIVDSEFAEVKIHLSKQLSK